MGGGERKKYRKIGYTQGVFDMFHIGHLNILRRAKEQCDYLIVGVNSDKLVMSYKNKLPVVSEEKRVEIIKNINVVDNVFLVSTLDKVELHHIFHFNTIFIGSDWKNSDRWQQTKRELEKMSVSTVFLPHTDGISSTILKRKINEKSN
ncbi:MAG: adenylyltransferase/cytidyltransferase family protein [Bacteroidota bacterium]|nr:adenylyltransferase/cytidyltransferase family protein [Bacteroidota bacterium]